MREFTIVGHVVLERDAIGPLTNACPMPGECLSTGQACVGRATTGAKRGRDIFFVWGHVTSEPNDPIVIDGDGRIGRIVYYIGQLYTWMQPWEN